MIHFLTGDMFESQADALVNTVNLNGIMGKGVALQFKKKFPANFTTYKAACINKSIRVGKLLVTKEIYEGKYVTIINFPTKINWRKPSEYSYIEAGLKDLRRIIDSTNIQSIAIPPLGAGNGGLLWARVKQLIETYLNECSAEIYVYEPTSHITELLKSERAKLTDARALLLYVMFDMVRQGEYVSEFSSEKICYFLQRFGAEYLFNLHYEPKYYGPYSGKVRYVLQYMSGSYIMGYSDMNRKPFETLSIVPDSFNDIKKHIEQNSALKTIANRVTQFLSGYYSDFGLELLSSVDFIHNQDKSLMPPDIFDRLHEWNSRKSRMFSDIKYIEKAYQHIIDNGL